MKVLTFGEIMLRLKAPGHERFFQSPMLEATFGGGEANVSVSLANYGMETAFVTVLPTNDVGNACIRELRGFGVDTTKIVRKDGRMGIYYLETGAVQRPSKVIYDRAGSAIAEAKPGDLIFFTRTYATTKPVSHVGIYVGGGQMLHCGSPIGYANIESNYWREHFYAIGRLPAGM